MEGTLDAGLMSGETIEFGGQVGVVEDVEVGLGGGGQFRFHAADAGGRFQAEATIWSKRIC